MSKYMALYYVKRYDQSYRCQIVGPFVGFLHSEPGESWKDFYDRAQGMKSKAAQGEYSSVECDIMTNMQPGLNT